MGIKIALAGNPNCGKTTLFNDLTGSNQYVGNWPGVTVEKKDGQLKGRKDVIIQDLPGIYSLSPYTLEEVVTRRYLVNEKPDAIINIIDGTNIERNLYLTTQLLELNIPTVVAINMMDLVTKNGDQINLEKLGKALGCTVVAISALKGDGSNALAEKAIELVNSQKTGEHPHVFSGSVEHALAHIEESLDKHVDRQNLRWFAVKIFERDAKVIEDLKLPAELIEHLEEHIKDCEKELDDDSESIITNQRYAYIKKVVTQTVQRKAAPGSLTFSDKIDLVVTNRVLALPIFAMVIWFMYWVAVSTIGTWMTDWANDGVFGDGWFVAGTTHCALFTSWEVKKRNMIFRMAFDAKRHLVHRNAEIAKANAEAKAAWQLECAQAWAAGDDAPEEPKYEEKETKVEFEPETWDSVSSAFADASRRVKEFEEAYSDAVHCSEELVEETEEDVKKATDLLAKATALSASAQDKEQAELYVRLLKRDADEKIAHLAALKEVIAKLPKPRKICGLDSDDDDDDDEAETTAIKAKDASKTGDEFEIKYPALAELLKVKVYFEDEESGKIDRTEVIDYDAYLDNKRVAKPDPSKYGLWVPGIPGLVESLLDKIGANDLIKSLILDGIIGGVGTVFGFLPQILIVFLFLAFLEDCGYMARVAFIMDRIFRNFGLSGKSFIPMLIGAGCGVPAVLASRTIESQSERRMTIILATFIPCGAKVAIIAMIVAAFFPESNLVGPSMYFLGIAIVVLGGIALRKTRAFAGESSHFMMELPAYHMPSLKSVLIHTWERGKDYAIKAGTIIFAACVVLWLMMHFDWSFNLLDPQNANDLEKSILHDIGQCIAWIFKPLGFGHWQGAVACVSAEIAKEQATATLALVSPKMGGGTLKGIQMLFENMVPAEINDPFMCIAYSKLIAFSFMVCNLFCPPCIGAIAATWREMGSAKWRCIAIGFQLLVGYCLSLVCFRLGILFWVGASFGAGQIAAIVVILGVLYAVFRPAPKYDSVKTEE